MKKTRKAHLWIGLIASILLLLESVTGLLMNESWLVGQSQGTSSGTSQQIQMNQGGTTSAVSGQNQAANSGQSQTASQTPNQQTGNNTSNQPQAGNSSNGQFQGPGGMGGNPGGPMGDGGGSSSSFMSIIKGLHGGRIGTTDIKWLTDIAALAMMFLTGTGVYLSLKALNADKKRKKHRTETATAVEGQ